MASSKSLGSSNFSSGISSPTPSITSQSTANSERNDYGITNERLCSALLWSAKFAFNKEKTNASSTQKQHRVNWKNPALYKTRLCDYWSTGNPCKFGLNCWFAHGPIELRHVPRLDQNPEATSIALAEVVQCLPPSRDRTLALELAESQLVANIKSSALIKQPDLNQVSSAPRSAPPQLSEVSFFGPKSKLTSGQKTTTESVLNKDPSFFNNPILKAIKRSAANSVNDTNSMFQTEQQKGPSPRSIYTPYMREQPAPIGLNSKAFGEKKPFNLINTSIEKQLKLKTSSVTSLVPSKNSIDDGYYRLFADTTPAWSLF